MLLRTRITGIAAAGLLLSVLCLLGGSLLHEQLLRQRLAAYSAAGLTVIFEKNGLPFAPILRPDQLFDDPHLNATGGLADITLPDGERAGQTARTTLFPLRMDGQRLGVFGTLFVAGHIGGLGILACCVGVLATGALFGIPSFVPGTPRTYGLRVRLDW